MNHCGSTIPAEIEQLRRIERVVRLGLVRRVNERTIELENGVAPTTPTTLHVDCSACGLKRRPVAPVFSPGLIRLQPLLSCDHCFSAAFIAHVETACSDDAAGNDVCQPVPHPDSPVDFFRSYVNALHNVLNWMQNPDLISWAMSSRLNLRAAVGSAPPTEPDELAKYVDDRVSEAILQGNKLEQLLEAEPSALIS